MAADKPEKNHISGIVQDIVLKFQHPVTSGSIGTSAIRFLNPENLGFAVGIVMLFCLEAEI